MVGLKKPSEHRIVAEKLEDLDVIIHGATAKLLTPKSMAICVIAGGPLRENP